MRLMRVELDGKAALASSRDGHGWRVDTSDVGPGDAELRNALAAEGSIDRLAETIERAGRDLELAKAKILPPVPLGGKILCIGLNYADHVAETGLPTPEDLTVFMRTADSMTGHLGALVRPKAEVSFDYEAELAVVIGRAARRVSRTNALSHVAGYTLLNDGSVRDAQMRSSQWTLGKNYDQSGSIGPCLVSANALPRGAENLRLIGKLNGDIVQDGNTSDMVFDVARIIEILSAVMTLNPGDIIATGTPAGVAMGAATPRWLRPADRFEVVVEGIGTLANDVVDEADLF